MARRVLLALAALLAPQAASAHLVGVEFGDFYAGALHVATGPEHVAGLAALALAAAMAGRAAGRWALVATAPAMVVGALVAAQFGDGGLDAAALGSLALLGLVVAAGLRPPPALFAALAAAAGLAHGVANGAAAVGGQVSPALFALGVGACGLLAVTLGAAAATAARDRAPRITIAYRVAGSWCAAIGLATLSLAALGR